MCPLWGTEPHNTGLFCLQSPCLPELETSYKQGVMNSVRGRAGRGLRGLHEGCDAKGSVTEEHRSPGRDLGGCLLVSSRQSGF